MKLPPIANPQDYVGLFVYDFKTHVAVGYTAAEIRILRESQAHRGGTPYEIYRVTEAGGFELRGVHDDRLTAQDTICFLRREGAAARQDYDTLRAAANGTPAPCAVQLMLTKVYDLEPPHVTALVYSASATHLVAGWLHAIGFAGGDRVIGGLDARAQLLGSSTLQAASCTLHSTVDFKERTVEEVLETTDRALQR